MFRKWRSGKKDLKIEEKGERWNLEKLKKKGKKCLEGIEWKKELREDMDWGNVKKRNKIRGWGGI